MEQDNGSLFLMWLKKLDLIIPKHTQEGSQEELENWEGLGDHLNLSFGKQE